MSFFVYDSMRTDLLSGELNFEDNFEFKLMTSSYVPCIDKDTNFSEISAFEVVGGGYSNIVGPFTITQTTDQNKKLLTKDQLLWESITATFKYLICCDQATGKLVFCYGFNSDKVITNGDYRVEWPSDIIMELR